MTKKIKSLVVIVVAAVLILGVSQAAYAVPGGCPDEGAMPMNIGPLNPISGFPLWAQDSTGLTVEVCLDPLLCISSPPIPGNAFSQQIGFGAEGFMASAETSITTNVGLDALLVTAVELAFLTEDPIDGDQFPFTRLRIRVDVPVAGIYTVTHPYGRQVFIIEEADLGPGQEIRESFDISFVADTVHQGRIGPILRWDMDLPVLDANGEEYIGDLAVPHTVTGSPCGTNFFRIEAVELDGITPIDLGSGLGNPVTETLFTVTGKVFTGVAPTPLVANRTTYARQAGGNGQVDVFATSAPTAGVTFSGGLNLPVGERPLIGDGNGAFFTSVTLADASTLPATVSVTANNAGNDQTTLINLLTDTVTITRAEYNVASQDLTIEATSSDEVDPPPVLTAFGFSPPLTSGILTVNNVLAPPATVTVTSSFGGSDTEPVTVIAGAAGGTPPVAIDDPYSTDEDVPLVVAIPGVLANDTDVDVGDTLEAILGANVANGTLVLNLNGSFTYTPAPNFNGVDTFAYAARDSFGKLSGPAIVTITVNSVNDAPIANDDGPITTNVNTPVVIFVLTNDTDDNSLLDPGSVTVTSGPTNGGTVVTVDGNIVYTPNAGFAGPTDAFTYQVCDTGIPPVTTPIPLCDTADVTVTVTDIQAEVITVQRAQYRTNNAEWRINGSTTVPGPGNSIHIHVGDPQGPELGEAPVDALGNWALRVRNSPVLPNGATTITAHSTGGAIVTVPLQVR